MIKMSRSIVLGGLALTGFGSMALADEPAPAPAAAAAQPAPAAAPTAPVAAAAPNDGQIAGILLTANHAEVEMSKVLEKSKNADVKKFAQKMVADHSAVHKETEALAKKLKMKTEESEQSKSIKTKVKENLVTLKKLKGAEQDKAYIDGSALAHQEMLDTIDKTLLPSVKHEELKALLDKVRPAVASHLEEVKKIQASLAPKT